MKSTVRFPLRGRGVTHYPLRSVSTLGYSQKSERASAQGQQALSRYEQVLLQAYLEVLTHLAHLQNLAQSHRLKQQEVNILTQATTTANLLYKAGEADYLEVLLTQTEALEAQLELVEIELEILRARVRLYRALGGGW